MSALGVGAARRRDVMLARRAAVPECRPFGFAIEIGAVRELHLRPEWLNIATDYLIEHKDTSFFRMYPSEGQYGLRVLMVKPQYFLAMKLLAV